jgi:hypothetical protein
VQSQQQNGFEHKEVLLDDGEQMRAMTAFQCLPFFCRKKVSASFSLLWVVVPGYQLVP